MGVERYGKHIIVPVSHCSNTPIQIAWVVEHYLDLRDCKRFGLLYFLKKKYVVNIINVSKITGSTAYSGRSRESLPNGIVFLEPQSLLELRRELQCLTNLRLIITHVSNAGSIWNLIRTLRVITKQSVPTLNFLCNLYPGYRPKSEKNRLLQYFLRAKRQRNFGFTRLLINRLPYTVWGMRPETYLVVSGRKCLDEDGRQRVQQFPGRLPRRPGTRLIWAHSMDYELYREFDRKHQDKKKNIAVYIDEGTPFHPDSHNMAKTGFAPDPPDPHDHYGKLCALFDLIDQATNLEVVIAAVPRVDYSRLSEDFFQGRKIVSGKIVELVVSSSLVIAHRSTAIQYAVLANKPVLLVATQNHRCDTNQWPYIAAYSRALNKEPVFYDNPEEIDLERAFIIDRKAYDRFKRDYIKVPESPDIGFWDLVFHELTNDGVFQN